MFPLTVVLHLKNCRQGCICGETSDLSTFCRHTYEPRLSEPKTPLPKVDILHFHNFFHAHSPIVNCLLGPGEGVHQQGGDRDLVSRQSWTDRPRFPLSLALFPPCYCPTWTTALNCSLVEEGAGIGNRNQRHASDMCNTPVNTCFLHLRSEKTQKGLSSNLDPEGKKEQNIQLCNITEANK